MPGRLHLVALTRLSLNQKQFLRCATLQGIVMQAEHQKSLTITSQLSFLSAKDAEHGRHRGTMAVSVRSDRMTF